MGFVAAEPGGSCSPASATRKLVRCTVLEMRSRRVISLVLVGTSVACVGAPPPPPGNDGSDTSTTSTTSAVDTTGLVPVTTAQVDTSATAGGTGTSTGGSDTTMGVLSSSSGTTMGIEPTSSSGESSSGGSSSSGSIPECMDEMCPNNQLCGELGTCVDACGGAWGDGTYANCINAYGAFDTAGLCGLDHLCIYDADPISGVTCSPQACVDACDCPAPAGTGDATVTCANITGMGDGGINDCYLSCGDGETCPTGMSCFAGFLCMTPVPANVPLYGNCEGLVPDCAVPAFCWVGAGGESVCEQDCVSAGDCPAGPPTGAAIVSCGYVDPANPGQECYLDCGGGQACPDGMSCFGPVCAFP